MLLETTINQIEQITSRDHPGARDSRAKAVTLSGSIQATALPPGILFTASTQTGHKARLRAVETTHDDSGVVVQLVSGDSITITPISKNLDSVQMNCSCEDFTFRLARANSVSGVLFGNITKPYIKKTNSPPNTSVGACKHLLKLVSSLTDVGVLV
jgi:hypothetical protein